MLRVGTSGWTYPSWRGPFYPDSLPRRLELAHASRIFNTLEINASFYSLRTPGTYHTWFDATPSDFLFAVKGGRYVTHMKRLKDVRVPLANYYASGILRLAHKTGPFLWQLPANVPYDADVLEAFLALLPRSMHEAASLARHHDARLEGRAYLTPEIDAPLRHALEVRHHSFLTPDFPRQLRRHGVALVVADAAGLYPLVEEVTADFVYVRLHGSQSLYSSPYSPAELEDWAARVTAWHAGTEPEHARRLTNDVLPAAPRDVYVYFDNDVNAYAPRDAHALARCLGLPVPATPD